jgi:hypothetical protein
LGHDVILAFVRFDLVDQPVGGEPQRLVVEGHLHVLAQNFLGLSVGSPFCEEPFTGSPAAAIMSIE